MSLFLGNSLGKNNSGIVQPIKANFKFDNSGFGSTAQKSEAGNHWWERVFNEASNNLQVENGQKISTVSEDGVELTNKTYSMKKIKENHGEMTYGSFLKSSTLLANVGEEVEIPGHITTDDIEIKMIPEISDEALFTACEGRTAHKGARHGLSLSGKLARLEEQDRVLLEKLKNNGSKVGIFKGESKSENDEDGFTVVTSKKKKKKQKNQDKTETEGNQSDHTSQVYLKKSKKKEKRDKKIEKGLIESLESKLEVMDDDQMKLNNLNKIPTQPDKKKRKKKKSSEEESDSVPQDPGKYRDPASGEPPKKKKKKKNIDLEEEVEQQLSKKQLKREERRKRLLQMDLEVEENPKKKKKIETSESSSPDVLLKLNPPHRKKWKKPKMEKVEQEDAEMEEKSEPEFKKEKINWKRREYIADLSNKLEAAARFEDSKTVDTSPSS